MGETRKLRIARRAGWTLGIGVLLLLAYMGSGIGFLLVSATGWRPPTVKAIGAIVYEPLNAYVNSGLPGSGEFQFLALKAVEVGRRITE